MHVRPLFLSLSVLSFAVAAQSQLTDLQQPTVRGPAAGPSGVVRRADGGTNGPILQSLFVPPKAGAPFSLTLSTEWTRPLANGGNWTLVNERHIMRDSKGRIYQERWILVPKSGKDKSWMNVFQITDPELHTWFNCEVKAKVCELLNYTLTTEETYLPAINPTGALPNGAGFRTHEDLGEGSELGVATHGYRDTTTINAGMMNDIPMVSLREFWYSAQLGFDLRSIVDDPQIGKQVFTVKDLSTAEPDVSHFDIPADYSILDHRSESKGAVSPPGVR